MQFIDLQNRAIALAQFEGWADVNPAPDWPTLTNQAWAEFSWDAECILSVQTMNAVTTQDVLLPGNWKIILDVLWNGAGVERSVESYERLLSSGWRGAATGTPTRWVVGTFNTLSLIPAPATSGTLVVRGIIEGPAMVASTDLPGQVNGVGQTIPDVFHEAIAARAAWLQGVIYAQGDAIARLSVMEQRYQEYVQDCRAAMGMSGYRRIGGPQMPVQMPQMPGEQVQPAQLPPAQAQTFGRSF